MGNSFNKPSSSKGQQQPSEASNTSATTTTTTKSKCSDCKCKGKSAPLPTTASDTQTTKSQEESFTKDETTSSMIVLHSDAPSDTCMSIKPESFTTTSDIIAAKPTDELTDNGVAAEAATLTSSSSLEDATSTEPETSREQDQSVENKDLMDNDNVLEFSISGQKLKLNSAEDVAEHVQFLKSHPNIKTVRFDGNTLGVEAAKALSSALSGLEKIEEFYLNDCFTGRMKEQVHVAVEEFCKVLKDKSSLYSVDFSDNAFGPIGAKAASILISEAVQLRQLVINNCGLGPDGGKIIAEALRACQNKNIELNKPSSLRVIQLGRNRLENGSSVELSEAFAAHGLLEEIAIPQCGIRPEGIINLSCGIAGSPNLQKLNLQDNTFTNQASLPLAKAIETLKNLVFVDIGDCLVGNLGCKAIVKALVTGGSAESTQVLNIQYGEMDEEGAHELATFLPKFKSLKVLMLNGNAFDPNGRAATAIKDALQRDERCDILDSWSDMEYEDDEDSDDFDEEQEEEKEKEELKLEQDLVIKSEPLSMQTNDEDNGKDDKLSLEMAKLALDKNKSE